jgi:hypothetical protein
MSKTAVVAVLGLVFVIVCGCKSGRTAKQIAEIRKGGNAPAAREIAVKALEEDADQMEVWRQLALTDLWLAKNPAQYSLDPAKCLSEAALMCMAVLKHEEGQASAEWISIGRQIGVDAISQANRLLTSIPTTTEKSTIARQRTFNTEFEENLGYDEHVYEVETTYTKVANLETAGLMIRQAAAALYYVQNIPQENGGLETHIQQTDSAFFGLTRRISNISGPFITDQRAAVDAAMAAALEQALRDLDNEDSFEAATILRNKLLELL